MVRFEATWPDGSTAQFSFAYGHLWGFERCVKAMYARTVHHYGRDPHTATWQVLPEPEGYVVMVP